MALGIDAAAHYGALEAGGSTVAVLGCGIDVCYPSRHADLRERIIAGGSVITEEPAGTPPFKYNFPKRNRIIAALAHAVVVVEATERSGALSTARWAADLGREVLAVPGSIRARQSSGTNLLIRDGVRPFLGIGDLLRRRPGAPGRGPGNRSGRSSRRGLAEASSVSAHRCGRYWHAWERNRSTRTRSGSALGLSPRWSPAGSGALELAGAVMSLPGGLVARTV